MLTCSTLWLSLLLFSSPQEAPLERRITLHTEPARLQAVLNQVAQKVGISARVDERFAGAVVVVAVQDRPAGEVVQRLADSLGLYQYFDGRTLDLRPFSLRKADPGLVDQHRAILDEYLSRMSVYLRSQNPPTGAELKSAGDDIAEVNRIRSSPTFQPGFEGHPPTLYETLDRTPFSRLTVRLLQVLGAEALARLMVKDSGIISSDALTSDQKGRLDPIFKQFQAESREWAELASQAPFRSPDALLVDKLVTGFTLSYRRDGNQLRLQLLSAGRAAHTADMYLPNEYATSWLDKATPFDESKVDDGPLPASARRQVLGQMLRTQVKPIHWSKGIDEVLASLASPEKVDPISLSAAQPLAEAARKADLDLIAVLDDNQLEDAFDVSADHSAATCRSTFQRLRKRTHSTGIWRSDKWVVVGIRNPSAYIQGQADRKAMARFLSYPAKQQTILLQEYLTFFNATHEHLFEIWLKVADLLFPGFETIHAYAPFAAVIRGMTRDQIERMFAGGVVAKELSEAGFRNVRDIALSDYHSSETLPDGRKKPFPTPELMREARVQLGRLGQADGFIAGPMILDRWQNPAQYRNGGFYHFLKVDPSYPLERKMDLFTGSKGAWPSRQTMFALMVAIPGSHRALYEVSQFELTTNRPPLTLDQLKELFERGD